MFACVGDGEVLVELLARVTRDSCVQSGVTQTRHPPSYSLSLGKPVESVKYGLVVNCVNRG